MSREKDSRKKKLPIDYMPQISNVASATDCTGLVPNQPQNEDELENYMGLSSTSLPPRWEDDDDPEEKPPRE